jgi:hypothetical protein
MAIPAKVATRLAAGLKKFQPILAAAKARDVNESDTVVIITDLLQEIFGYDKYSEITSEHMIRGTFCDLAIKLDGGLQLLLEIKAIGLELKDQFVKQAVDYAANQGTDWVVLTNGIKWRIYRVKFAKPIEQELVLEFDLTALNPKSDDHLEKLWLIAKEGWLKSGLGEFVAQREALSRFFLGAVAVSPPVLEVIRRELRRLSPDVRIDIEEIKDVLVKEVIKREVIEGEKAEEAKKQLNRAANRALRAKNAKGDGPGESAAVPIDPIVVPPPEEPPSAS